MKEVLKAVWKILKIVLVFFLFLGIIALAWYAIEIATLGKDETAVPFVDFILYLLGFGDINSKDHYLQTAFSTLGLFAVTLLSSVFTVNLFELRRKVNISPKAIVKSKYFAKLELKAAGKDIYDLTATLISKCGQDVTTEEQRFPFIPKKSTQELIFKIAPGTAIYKYLRSVYLGGTNNPQLILTVSYTDIESGQTYVMAQKYQYSKEKKKSILFTGNEGDDHDEDFEENVRTSIIENIFSIDLSTVAPCNAEDIDIYYGYHHEKLDLSAQYAFCAYVHMNSNKSYDSGTFTMAYIKELLGNDWTIYYDLGCTLKFDFKVEGDIAVTMELKCGANNRVKKVKKFTPMDGFETYSLNLHEMNREDLIHVSELCFTVLYGDVDRNNPVGSFVIKNCALEIV